MPDESKNACRKRKPNGKSPCSVTMPVKLQEAVIRQARREDRSFSAVVRRALEQYVSAH